MATGRKPKLNLVTVHGTFSGIASLPEGQEATDEFYMQSSGFAQNLISRLSKTYEMNWRDFQWSGANLESERTKASQDLDIFLETEISLDENLLLLAHSHGGNVAFDWVNRHPNKFNTRLVTMGTPFVNLYRVRLKQMFFSTIMAFIVGCIMAGVVSMVVMTLDGSWGDEDFSGYGTILLVIGFLVSFVMPFYLFVIKPFRLMRGRWKLREKPSLSQKMIYIICHPGDEAVSFLKSKTQLNVPVSFLAKPLLYLVFIISWVVITIALLLAEDFSEEALDGYYVFGYMIAGSIAAVLLTAFFVFLPMKIFGRVIGGYLERKTGNMLSNFLWELARGSDTLEPLDMQRTPQLPEDKFVMVDPDTQGLAQALEVADEISLQYLAQNKSRTIRGLMETGGNFFEFLHTNPEIANSLVHCNYFNPKMATYLGDSIPEMLERKT